MSQDENCRACETIFAKYLGGHPLMSNATHVRGSAWLNFPRVLCETWSYENIVLMGDAAATAHFSVGSRTKLAMESAIAMANYLRTEPNMQAAFAKYAEVRRTQFAGMVRGRRALPASRPGAVQLLAADAFATHQP